METSGQGEKLSFATQLEVIGSHALTDEFQVFNKTNFANLVFAADNDYLFDFDEDTGIFLFKRTGHLQILATLNFATTGVSEFQVSPAFKRDPGAWSFLNSRRGVIPVIGGNDLFLSGSVDIIKGDMMRFEIRDTNIKASLVTEALPNGSQFPATVMDFLLMIR